MGAEPKEQSSLSPVKRKQSPLALAGLGAQFFGALLVFVYAGNWLDTRLGTSPLCLLTGVFGGGGGSFFLSYRQLMRGSNKADTGPSNPPDRSDRL